MNVIKNEMMVAFDVDDTLVMHGADYDTATSFKCPYTGVIKRLKPHYTHIQLLKEQKARGFHVTVWSAAGWQWAETIVKALSLEKYVDSVQTKPVKVFDDQPADRILQVLYIKDV